MSELNNNLEFWKKICENVDYPIAFMDYDNNFLCCNKYWVSLFHFSSNEMSHKDWGDITKKKDLIQNYSFLKKIKEIDGEEYYLDKVCVGKDNEIHTKMYIRNLKELNGYIIIAKNESIKDYEDLKNKFLDLRQAALLEKHKKVSQECKVHNQCIILSALNSNNIINQKTDKNYLPKSILKGIISGGVFILVFIVTFFTSVLIKRG